MHAKVERMKIFGSDLTSRPGDAKELLLDDVDSGCAEHL